MEQDEMREKVQADERHRLALYLHDHIGQTLTLTKLQLTRIQQALREPLDTRKQAWLQATVDSLIPEIDTVMQAVREERVGRMPLIHCDEGRRHRGHPDGRIAACSVRIGGQAAEPARADCAGSASH